MRNHKTVFSLSELPESVRDSLHKQMLLLDIETTGLSSAKNFIYCIGCSYPEGADAVIRLFFGCGKEEEQKLLSAFAQLLSSSSTIVTFNGSTFDIPFLKKRYRFYHMEDPFAEKNCIDLYREATKLKPLLALDSYSQKSLETFLGCSRIDPYTGGELISVYKKYCKNPTEDLLHLLLQHNLDDVRGMYDLISLLSYRDFLNGNFQIKKILPEQDEKNCFLNFLLEPSRPFPQSVHRYDTYKKIILDGKKALVQLPVYEGELKHFFKDYKNYFYLPQEDTVIHRSVGTFVDPAYRQKAVRENCCVKKHCTYLMLPGLHGESALKKDYYDKQMYLDISEFQEKGNTFSLSVPDSRLSYFHDFLLLLLQNI